jgi:medium-chain acyl-[acyl-carrier-protein] hydrolase
MKTKQSIINSWITHPRSDFAKLRLFCFPYAGGRASIFRSWSKKLTPYIEVCPIELPGRGNRLNESPFTRLEPLIQALAPTLLPYLDRPFTFFGHSMGGLISFELAHLIYRNYGLVPSNLFISGRCAPQISASKPPIHDLPKPEFLDELRRLNGTPKAVLENTELMELLMPSLRADFTLLETYVYTYKPCLNCPITVLGGLQDSEVSCGDLEAWREETNANFSIQMFEGNHFFIHSAELPVLQFLSQELGRIVKGIN